MCHSRAKSVGAVQPSHRAPHSGAHGGALKADPRLAPISERCRRWVEGAGDRQRRQTERVSGIIPWEQECRATAAAMGIAVEHIEVGAQNVVLISDDVVLRFPILRRDADRISELALRHRRAAELGLRAPEVLDHADGPPGRAHLVMRRFDGLPLTAAVTRLDSRKRRRALGDVIDLLEALRRVEAQSWPFGGQDWVSLWAGLPERLDRLAHGLPRARLRDWYSVAYQAADVAASAPLGLMHGDLQDPNVRIGGNGRLVAVLDWDSALIGDPALDTAAVLHSVGPHAPALVASFPWLAEDMRRFEIYRTTWELQHALWRAGDDHWLFTSS